MRHRSPLPFLAVGLAVCTATVGLTATAALGAPGPETARVAAAATLPAAPVLPPSGPNTAASVERDLGRAAALPWGLQPPGSLAAPSTSTPAKPADVRKAAPSTSVSAAAQSCTPADFGSRTGSALVSFIKTSTHDCINTLFNLTGTDAADAFRESQMVTVANAFHTGATAYPGDNSTSIWQLVLFLRAGYYVQYNYPTVVGAYGPTLASATEGGLDAFVAGPHLLDVSSANGDVVGEVVTLTDSANEQARYLGTYKRMLNAYTSAWDAYPSMDRALNNIYTPLFRGHQNPAYIAAVTADPGIIDALNTFALNHFSLLSGAKYQLDTNAGAEAVRFIDTPALQAKVRPLIKNLVKAAPIPGPNGAMWVRVATVVDYYDNAECQSFGTCDIASQLTAAVLPNTYACGTRTLMAQALTQADLTAVCRSLQGEDAYYHGLVKDSGPIPGQYMTNLRLAVFATKQDYTVYSTAIFGNDTNNGGETLTGNPTDPNNSPVSVMYEKFPGDGFVADVWNLNHEYTHLLQSIYDMKGDFGTQITVPDIWWVEGEAEYVSYTYRGDNDTQAVDEAGLHSYALSTLFQTTYDNTTTDRTYQWGYLAVRYMLEKHPADVQAMLAKFRVADYTGGYAVYNSIGTRYDADFDAWLDACAAGACLAPGAPEASFTTSANGLSVTFNDTSTDSGSTPTLERWSYGDANATVSTTAGPHPTFTYSAPGTYTIALTVTDAKGLSSTAVRTVTVTGGGTALPPCPSSNVQAMDKDCSRTNQSASTGNYDYLWIYLPAGTVTLNVTTTGGTGNADLYYNPDTWATKSAYTAKSTNSGDAESLTVTNTTAGYRYISLYAATAFSGVTVSTQY